jgi:hypothetical protein
MTLGLWDDEPPDEPGGHDLPEPALELEAGRTALVAGRFDEAVLHFGLALRIAPALAPAVLEATAGSRAPSLLMIRGDAYRLAGHEVEAREAYLAAARGGLPERRRRSRLRPAKVEPTDDLAASGASDSSEPDSRSDGKGTPTDPKAVAESDGVAKDQSAPTSQDDAAADDADGSATVPDETPEARKKKEAPDARSASDPADGKTASPGRPAG